MILPNDDYDDDFIDDMSKLPAALYVYKLSLTVPNHDEELRLYHRYRHELYSWRCGVLQGQGGHPIQTETTGVGDHPCSSQGVSGMIISRVEETVFWPGISPDILKTRPAAMTALQPVFLFVCLLAAVLTFSFSLQSTVCLFDLDFPPVLLKSFT